MITQASRHNYELECDNCGDTADEYFEDFYDAVEYKKDRSNRWRSIKDADGNWNDLCPSCNTREVIVKLRGDDCGVAARYNPADALAALAMQEESYA